MRVTDHTNKKDAKILAGMITHPSVLGKIAKVWGEKGLFAAPCSNLIGSWCVTHFRKRGQPPGKHIEDYFEDFCNNNQDRDTADGVERLLRYVSDDYERHAEEVNPEFLIEMANKHFDAIRLEQTLTSAQAALAAGEVAKAQEKVTSYVKIPLDAAEGVDVLQDDTEIQGAFESRSQVVVQYDGALGEFFGCELERENFVAFLAPEKTGKTFWLLDVAWRAMCQRKRVAFFQCGDLSKRQMLRRFYARAARHPYRSSNADMSWPCVVRYPEAIRTIAGKKLAEVEHEERPFDAALDWHKAKAACEQVMYRDIRSKRAFLKLFVYPTKTISVNGIHSVLQTWQLRDWVPDCVCIDYADILADQHTRMDRRDGINATWEDLRKLSEQWKCLVVTATQADADSYEREILDRRNFSEDKRKNAHTTGIIGINVNADEKELGVCRLNWIVKREGEYSSRKCVHVASCLPLANPAVLSTW